MKKILSLILVALMLLSALPMTAFAEENSDYSYKLMKDGTISITKYNGKEAEVVIPDTIDGYTVSAIGKYAFSKNKTIEKVTIPSTVITIENRAFYDCGKLEIIGGESVEYIGAEAFGKFYEKNFDDGEVYIGKVLYKYVGETPETLIIKDGTTQIAPYAFLTYIKTGPRNLKKVVIPDSVTEISKYAFRFCRSLTTVEMSNNIKKIDYNAFYGCYNLKSIDLPQGLEVIGDGVFANCDGLVDVTIPDSVKSLGEGVYSGCDNLESVKLPAGLESIGDTLFFRCLKLTNIEIPDTVTTIGTNAFFNCVSLKKLDLPENLTKIDNAVFSGCSGLTEINIADGVKRIGKSAFSHCNNLTEVTIPASVSSIGTSAFGYCEKLEKIQVDESNNRFFSVDGVLFKKKAKQIDGKDYICLVQYPQGKNDVEYIVPDGVIKVNAASFRSNDTIEKIVLSDTVKRVSLRNCTALKEVVIPLSVTTIKRVGYVGRNKTENFTIYGENGSAAETYANTHGFKFIEIR